MLAASVITGTGDQLLDVRDRHQITVRPPILCHLIVLIPQLRASTLVMNLATELAIIGFVVAMIVVLTHGIGV